MKSAPAMLLASLITITACSQNQQLDFKSVAVDGGDIAYTELGNPSGEPVLLIQGSFVADAFLPLARTSELQEYRLILVNLRGYGRSSRIPIDAERFWVNEHARDIVGLIDALELERVSLVGHSLGGDVALQAALNVPQPIRSLALIEPGYTADFYETLAREAEERGDQPFVPPPPPTDREELITYVENLLNEAFGGIENVDRIPGAYEQALTDYFDLETSGGSALFYLWEFDTRTDLPELDQPILFIQYQESYGPFADLFQQNGPNVELYRFPKDHHSVHVERPDEVAPVLADFLERTLD